MTKLKTKATTKKSNDIKPVVMRWKPKTAWALVGKRDVWQMPLKELIEVVDALFPTSKPKLSCYNYGIDRMPYGWCFVVTNSWQAWSRKKLQHNFGAYSEIEGCLAAFLEYVIKNKIEPHKLYER